MQETTPCAPYANAFGAPPAIRRRTPAERSDEARLTAIGRVPVLYRTPADLAFEDAVSLGETYPETAADTLAGFLAGVRIAERRTGRDGLLADAIRAARATLRRGDLR
jgi:hypothetical protein